MDQKKYLICTGIKLIFFLLVFLSFNGCYLKRGMMPEESLRSRVAAYWDARVQGDNEKAYDLIEPGAKENISMAGYARRTAHSTIIDYNIRDIKIDSAENEAVVQVERSFKINPGIIPIKIDETLHQTSSDKWVFVDGQWYMVYGFPGFNLMNLPVGPSKKNIPE